MRSPLRPIALLLLVLAGCGRKQPTVDEFIAGTHGFVESVNVWVKTPTPENLDAAITTANTLLDGIRADEIKHLEVYIDARLVRGTLTATRLTGGDPKAVGSSGPESPWELVMKLNQLLADKLKENPKAIADEGYGKLF